MDTLRNSRLRHPDWRRRIIIAVSFLLATSVAEIGTAVSAQGGIADAAGQSLLVQQLTDPKISDRVFKLRLLPLTKDDLAKLAGQWLVITRESVRQTADLGIALSETTGLAEESIRADLTKRLQWRHHLFRKLALILDDWSAKGAAKEEVNVYIDYATAVLRTEAHAMDVKTVLRTVWGWVTSFNGGLRLLSKTGIFIISLFLLNVVAHVLSALLKRSLFRRGTSSILLLEFIRRTAYWTLFVIGATFVLSFMGVTLTPLVAAFGGASVIIGFATQSTLSNFVSGLLLMVNRPFDVGDKVRIAGVSGIVESVTTISTVVRDIENRTTIIPNKTVWENVIINEGKADFPSQ